MSKRNSKNGNTGCLGVIVFIVLLSFAITLYSYCWIPAIPILIYCLSSKKFKQYKTRNTIICSIVIVTSLLVFIWLNTPEKLEDLEITWSSTEFVVDDTIELPISKAPSEAEIKKLEMCDNSIADFTYKDDKATITFKEAGNEKLYLIANGEIKSNAQEITVITKEEKEDREQKARKEAERKAKEEAEKIAAEKAEEEARIAAEQKAKEEAEQKSAEESRIQAEQQAATQSQNQSSEDPTVYTTNTGSKYHRAGCRTLKKSKIEQKLSDVKGIYEPCGICNPPQ